MAQTQWHPGRLLETSGSYWRSCTLHAGVKLDIFTCVGDENKSAAIVAKELNTNADATARLLDALSAMGLLSKQAEKYGNTRIGRTFLSKDSDQYLGHMILHHHHLVESWSRLDEAVTSGKPISDQKPIDEETRREHFLMGMFNNASQMAPGLVKAFELSNRAHLLDLGGGPGTYAIHFCLANPDLKATVFDLPTTRPFAEKTIARFGLADRIDFTDGNYIEEDIPGHYDVVWMSHIIHSEGAETAEKIIKKAADILEPGGMIMIHDFFLNDPSDPIDGPLFPALFSLNMLVRTKAGRSYSQNEITTMLRKAGFGRIQRHDYTGPTESGVITAIR